MCYIRERTNRHLVGEPDHHPQHPQHHHILLDGQYSTEYSLILFFYIYSQITVKNPHYIYLYLFPLIIIFKNHPIVFDVMFEMISMHVYLLIILIMPCIVYIHCTVAPLFSTFVLIPIISYVCIAYETKY